MSYSVYIHTNKVNGKKYVGVTTMKPETRWGNGRKYKNNTHFTSAIDKYGWDFFDHYIVEVDSAEKMYALEKFYIDFYHTTDPDKGYNRSLGGDSGCFKGKNYGTKEYKEEYNREYYRKHKEAIKLQTQMYRETHKEKVKENSRLYNEAHKEEKKAYDKMYWEKNREKRLLQHKEWMKKCKS